MGSRSPSPMGIDQCADDQYQWSDKEKEILQAWTEYTYNLDTVLNDLWKYGPEGLELPRKPRQDIRKLLNAEAKKTKTLCGEDLHVFLQRHIIAKDKYTIPKVTKGLVSSLDEAKELLKNGYEFLKEKNARVVLWMNHSRHCLQYRVLV